jgi:hypothetical protein
MAFRKFKTDRRLWFWISLVIFVIPWLLPIIVFRGHAAQPAVLWSGLFTDPNYMDSYLAGIGIFTLAFGVPAVAISWVFQWMIVSAKNKRKHKTSDACSPPPAQTGQIH